MEIPVLTRKVRVIGGPMGPPTGPTGLTGPESDPSLTGPTGRMGPTGRRGHTGLPGRGGFDSTMTGPMGVVGPTALTGSQGPMGPPQKALIPDNQIAYFENEAGVINAGAGGGQFVGCGFTHTLTQKTGTDNKTSVLFTGLIEATAGANTIWVYYGFSFPAPSPGMSTSIVSNFGVLDNEQHIVVPAGKSFPFFITNQLSANGTGPFWFDLVLANSAGNVATAKHISCLLMEFV